MAVTALVRSLGAAGRFLFIGLVALVALLGYGTGRLLTLFERDAAQRAIAVNRLRGRVLRHAMTTLGATFIKLGQVMSTRPDLFPPALIGELRVLQDKLPPFGFDHVARAIAKDLGGPIEQFYTEFDRQPVAAASVAQVHRGRLHDGQEVAVKVLRPNVRRTVLRDAGILSSLARLAALHPTLERSDPVGHLEHLVGGILAQTDLRIEAENYTTFRANFAGFDGIAFPEVHPEFSGTHVMTMAFCRGSKIDELESGSTVPRAAVSVRNAFFKMCFEDGFLHADLHPGNMLVHDNGDVTLFDVGLVLEIGDELLEQFVDFAKCISMGDDKDFVAHLKRYHNYMSDVDWDAIGIDAERFVSSFRSQSVSELEWGAVINDLFDLARRHDIHPVPEMALVLVGIVTAEGIGKQLNPNGNSFQEMATFLMPILAKRGMLNG
ncbi:MAG: ubiquinone biosynthesis protein [Myxococcota bacterium]